MIQFNLLDDICAISGQLTQTDVVTLWPQRRTLIDSKARILDLSKLYFSDSAGIAFILTLWQEFKHDHGDIKMMSPSSQMQDLIKLYNLQKAFHSKD